MKFKLLLFFILPLKSSWNSPCLTNEYLNEAGPHRCENDNDCQGDW